MLVSLLLDILPDMEADALAVFKLVTVDTTEVVTVATAPLLDASSKTSLNVGCSSVKSASGLTLDGDEPWVKTMCAHTILLPFIIDAALIALYISFT